MRQVSPLHHLEPTAPWSNVFFPTKSINHPLPGSSEWSTAASEMLDLDHLTASAEKLVFREAGSSWLYKSNDCSYTFSNACRPRRHYLWKETQRLKEATWLSVDHRARITLLQFIPNIHLCKLHANLIHMFLLHQSLMKPQAAQHHDPSVPCTKPPAAFHLARVQDLQTPALEPSAYTV